MPGKPKIRVLLADVDGTLVTPQKELTQAALAAARELQAAGVTLSITSGRPPRGVAMLIEPLALTGPIAGFNGGVFVNPDLSVIESHPLDSEVAREALDLILKSGLDGWVYTQNEWLIRDKNAPHVAREAWTVKFEARVVLDFTEEHLSHAVKIVGVSDDHDFVARTETAVQNALGSCASAARSQPYYLDVTNPKANKGEVVRWLARTMNIDPKEIATIGDMPNDVQMFKVGGLSIAMGNASKEVQAEAGAVTETNEANGFAKAVRRFLLA
jgi:Cof subfamily protein (haloacid dehalogenase superfamily)